ncbi:hypothetical protein E3P96_03680 [Wallemia ichthyophaga]|nr:hypothetical protein E3P96_03680 [Wallemia ichthyophaga]
MNGSEKLLKVIKNPITDHLPINCHKITLSGDAPTTKISDYLPSIPQDKSICVFVGAMAHGQDNFADAVVDEKVSISNYSLSASVACGKFCTTLEDIWDKCRKRIKFDESLENVDSTSLSMIQSTLSQSYINISDAGDGRDTREAHDARNSNTPDLSTQSPSAIRIKLFALLNSNSDMKHPLCVDCANVALQLLAGELDDLKRERDAYMSFDSQAALLHKQFDKKDDDNRNEKGDDDDIDKHHLLEQLQRETSEKSMQLDRLEAEKRDMESEMHALAVEEDALEAEETAHLRRHSLRILQQKESQQSAIASQHTLATAQNELDRLEKTNVWADVFRISSDGGIGTICGLRLGRIDQNVEWSEINAAWGHVAFLLYSVANKLQFEFSGSRIIPLGSYSRIERATQTQNGVKWETLELHHPGSALSMLHTRRFDQAMVTFLDMLRQLVDDISARDTCVRWPYKIGREKLADHSIRLPGQFTSDRAAEEEWTRALRGLLDKEDVEFQQRAVTGGGSQEKDSSNDSNDSNNSNSNNINNTNNTNNTHRKLSRREKKFYKSQDQLIESYLHNDNASTHTSNDNLRVQLAIYGSMAAAFFLTGLQLYAAISSLSLSFFSTLINTLFDPISNILLDWFYKKSLKLNKNKWPDGGSRLTSIANCCFSFIMIMVNFSLIVESVRSLIVGKSSTQASSESGVVNGLHVPSIAAVGVAFLVKIVLFVYCGLCKHLSSQVEMLFIDHRNDLPVNGFGILTSAGGSVLRWWIDPLGSIVISIAVITVWIVTLVRQFNCLAGVSAVEKVRKRVLYKTIKLDVRIMYIDSCYVYHCGHDLNVRVAVALDRSTQLHSAQQLALNLQNELRGIENVNGVFVELLAAEATNTTNLFQPQHIFMPYDLSTIDETESGSASRTHSTSSGRISLETGYPSRSDDSVRSYNSQGYTHNRLTLTHPHPHSLV